MEKLIAKLIAEVDKMEANLVTIRATYQDKSERMEEISLERDQTGRMLIMLVQDYKKGIFGARII